MIDSPICNDCICLPICISKRGYYLITECRTIGDVLKAVSVSLKSDEGVTINFIALNKEFSLHKGSNGSVVSVSII